MQKKCIRTGEVQRRFGFEYNGMRNHEVYFSLFLVDSGSGRKQRIKTIAEEWVFDAWLNRFKSIALTRGIGWAMLYYDRKEKGC